jgi:uncharacterized protein (DUF779 family)
MVERVTATEAALALIKQLKAKHGPDLMFYQSGGCCDGSAPMCYRTGELNVSRYDYLLGQIGGCNFFMSQSQYEYWQHTQLIIDAVKGMNDNFSLEGSEGMAFLTKSRLYTDEEAAQLTELQPAG